MLKTHKKCTGNASNSQIEELELVLVEGMGSVLSLGAVDTDYSVEEAGHTILTMFTQIGEDR